jgi:hypothetical protein
MLEVPGRPVVTLTALRLRPRPPAPLLPTQPEQGQRAALWVPARCSLPTLNSALDRISGNSDMRPLSSANSCGGEPRCSLLGNQMLLLLVLSKPPPLLSQPRAPA